MKTGRTLPEKLFTGAVIVFLLMLALIPLYRFKTQDNEFTLQSVERILETEIPQEATEIELEVHREYQAGGFRLSFNLPPEQSTAFASQFCDGILIEEYIWANGTKLPPQHYGNQCLHNGYSVSIEVNKTNPTLDHIIIHATSV